MRKNTVLVTVSAICVILIIGVIWYISSDKMPSIPNLNIPGKQSVEVISTDNRGADLLVKIKHLGMDYDCNLHLALSKDRKWILPLSDELFTVVVADESGLELSSNNSVIGRVPVVFIAPVNSSRTYRVGGVGQSKKPIYVKAGSVNLVSFDSNTLIRGTDGIRVRVFDGEKELSEGRIPLAINLEEQATLVIEDIQTRVLSGKGLIQGYWGAQDVRPGTNSIAPSGRFTGIDIQKFEGMFFGKTNNSLVTYNEKTKQFTTFNGVNSHVIALDENLTPDRLGFNHVTELGEIIYKTESGKYVFITAEGKVEVLNTTEGIDFTIITGDLLISDSGNIFNFRTQDSGIIRNKYDFFHDGIGLMYDGEFLTGYELSVNSEDFMWALQVDRPATEMIHVKDDIVFFTDGKACTMYVDIRQGLSSMVLDEFVLDNPLEMIDNHDLNFPGREGINEGVLAFGADGEMAWSRPGGMYMERVGVNAVMVAGGEEIHVYDIKTGIETCSWKYNPASSVHPTGSVEVKFADEYKTIIQIGARDQMGKATYWVVEVMRKEVSDTQNE